MSVPAAPAQGVGEVIGVRCALLLTVEPAPKPVASAWSVRKAMMYYLEHVVSTHPAKTHRYVRYCCVTCYLSTPLKYIIALKLTH